MLIRNNRTKISVSPGFLLLIAMLFYLDEGIGILPWGILAALLHELGHILAARISGGRVDAITFNITGAELRLSYAGGLSYGRENMIALAGPAANLLAGVPALCFGGYLFAITSFGLGLFNLVPILPLDGGRVLSNLISERIGILASEKALSVSAGISIGILVGFGVIAAVHYANITLLILALWLFIGSIRKKSNFSPNK